MSTKPLDLEEQEQIDQLKHFWSTWGNLITGIIFIILIIIAGYRGFNYWQHQKAVKVTELIDALNEAIEENNSERIKLAFEEIKNNYSKSSQSSYIALELANLYKNQNQNEEAKDVLKWLINNGFNEGLKSLSKLRLTDILITEKQFDEASKLLNENDYPIEFKNLVLDKKGDLFQLQNNLKEAENSYKEIYKNLINEENFGFKMLIEYKLQSLGVTKESLNNL